MAGRGSKRADGRLDPRLRLVVKLTPDPHAMDELVTCLLDILRKLNEASGARPG